MRRWIKGIGIACLIPIGLVLLISILLYIPFIQDFAVNTATKYAAKATGMQIEMHRIRLSFPLRLKITDALVINKKDTLLALDHFEVNVSVMPLLKKEVLLNGIDLRGVSLNTSDMLDGMILKGKLEKLKTKFDRIDLAKEIIHLERIDLSGTDINLVLTDTTAKEDTTQTTAKWKIMVDQIKFDRVSYAMKMDHDSLALSTYIDEASLIKGFADIGSMAYSATRFTISKSTFAYDMGFENPKYGFDPSHIALNNINIRLNDILYSGLDFSAQFEEFNGYDRSGLQIVSLSGNIESDSTKMSVPELLLQTAHSQIRLMAEMPWSALNKSPKGDIRSILKGDIGKEDVLILMGIDSKEFQYEFPAEPLRITAGLEGNTELMKLREMSALLPGAFNIDITGEARNLLDEKKRSFNLDLDTKTKNLDFVLAMLPEAERKRYNLPVMEIIGKATLKNEEYHADLRLIQDKGKVELNARCNPYRETYEADFKIDSINPANFLPQDSLYALAVEVHAEGRGFSPFKVSTWSKVEGSINNIQYGTSSLSEVKLSGSLEKNLLNFNINSEYPLAQLTMDLKATLLQNKITASMAADVEHLDLYGMHLMKDSLITSFQLFADGETNMKIDNQIDITLGNWVLTTSKNSFNPKTLTLHAFSAKDTTNFSFHAGDLSIVMTGDRDIETIGRKFGKINDEVRLQLKRDSVINIEALRQYLPELKLNLLAQRENPIYNVLQQYNISFAKFEVNASTSPDKGLFIDADLSRLLRDTTMIDSICFIVSQDSIGLLYDAHVIKNKFKKQEPFTAQVKGKIRNDFADAEMTYLDSKGQTGILVGARVDKTKDNAYRLHFFPDNPILAFKKYTINSDNYIVYKNIKDIATNVRLEGPDKASLWIHSQPEDHSLPMEVVHAELNHINLKQISDGFPHIPAMKGMFNADLQYMPSDSNFMVTADAYIDTFFYENGRVGELMFNTVYLPLSSSEHQVDFHFFRDKEEIMTANAYYRMGVNDFIKGKLDIVSMPFDMVNPFIPDNMAKMSGALKGEVAISGSSAFPEVDGYIEMDTASVFVTAVGSSVKFDKQRIAVKQNLITFDHYNLYTSGTNPFVINGTVDLHNPRRMMADLTLTANNMELLNVKRNKESMVYGKLLVNINSTVKGPLDALNMRGNLQLLGGTNVTYVLQDAAPTVQDKLAELVTFTDFADTIQSNIKQNAPLPIGGLNLLMTVMIDQSVKLNVDITQDQSSRVELEGGGDLSFQYTPQGDMFLNGRYTLSGGTVKYAMPIIPLKTFNIQNGSYVQWTGDIMNPTMSLTATESVRASVSDNNGGSRLVTFNVGLSLQQTLENMQMQFIISAPEDQTMQQELDRLGQEQESQIAVTMLVTGMYINMNDTQGGQKPNFNMGSALNSVLQSEINKIAGSALKSVDITLGMEQYDQNGNAGGGQRTDFSFRFAKKFYNDRISIIVGGKVSTGADANNSQNQPFIDNVSIEYRLDGSGTRYIKLFHDVNYDDLLEGEITETGAGIVLRKKMLHLRELFIFKRNKNKVVSEAKKAEVKDEKEK